MKRILLLLLIVSVATGAQAAVMEGSQGGWHLNKPAVLPNTQLRVHDVGKVWLTISNYGFFGSQDGDAGSDAAGIHTPLTVNCEFPGGSNIDYLFQGALWIGATVDTVNNNNVPIIDTLVSIGNDGWWGNLYEMFPASPPGGAIKVKSTRPIESYPYGENAGAHSEQDFVAVYTDTITNTSIVIPDGNDRRPHVPLHLEITQRSYAWSYEYAEDFVLFDFDIRNIGNKVLKNVWVGLYIDADVKHSSENPYGVEQGAQDDICGFDTLFVQELGGDSIPFHINTAWIADNNGQPYVGDQMSDDGTYDFRSPRGVTGVRVVRTPKPASELENSFNWWISNMNANFDWGPRLMVNGQDPFPGGGMGTPGGDKAKYKVMSNREWDYDQIWCNLDKWQTLGWIPKSPQASDLANGYDTRYLFSFGPFDSIPAGDTLKLTTAYVCGENVHNIPQNYRDFLKNATGDSASIATYYKNLDFTDFGVNSQWAEWVYDNPGIDTDGDGYRGDSVVTSTGEVIWIRGDGLPDFKGPPPPASPNLTMQTSSNTVLMKWDGKKTEQSLDPFSGKMDFEGYRIYKSATGRSDDYTLLADYDVIDYDFTFFNQFTNQWEVWSKPPIKPNEAALDTSHVYPNVPPGTSWDGIVDSMEINSVMRVGNWKNHGWNTGFAVVQPNPNDQADSTYSYTLTGLSESDGIYLTVTAYDYGNPVTKLSSLESSTSINATLVYPIAQAGGDNKVAVYPNPYRLFDSNKAGGYLESGREDADRSGNTSFDRRIWFAGLPQNWIIRIFTLDGDLVKKIVAGDAPYTQPTGDVAFWDLISRNTQAVVSGLYIYTIDADAGFHQIGKIAIIK